MTHSATIAAVEHYVAYWLVTRGFNVTMIQGLSHVIDLLVSAPDGSHSVTVRVKSSSNAHRTFTHHPARNRSGWEVTEPLDNAGPGLFYAFVDQREGSGLEPEVFIVPSERLEQTGARAFRSVWIEDEEMPGDPDGCKLSRETYLENHWLIADALAR